MTTFAAAVWLLFVPVVALIAVVLWFTESRHTKIKRWRQQGQTWACIATRLGCSSSTARRWAMA